ncbi:hypothetical protein KSAC_31770 (plasmid) [Komagataeibacter saccharivorans]|nr:hypothetical protein KSAC_31770 [Komagataeibacter saccharivorans]
MGATHRCLMRDRTATLNRLKNPHDQSAAAPRRHRLLQIEAQITSLDAPTDALVTEDAHLSQRWDVLASIPELGTVTAQALFCESAKELDLCLTGPIKCNVSNRERRTNRAQFRTTKNSLRFFCESTYATLHRARSESF